MKTIAFLNIKGGSGKTTSATAIAHIVSTYGFRVLLIDNDPQGSSTALFSGTEFLDDFQDSTTARLKKSIKDLLINPTEEDIKDFIRNTRYEGLDAIGADFTLIEAEREIVLDDSAPQQNRLKMHLDKVGDAYDYCFIDCGANAGLININALVASDEVIIPTTGDAYSLQTINNTVEMIENVSDFNVRLENIGIFYTRWEETKMNEVSYDMVEDKYGKSLLLPIKIRKATVCGESTLMRMPLLAYDGGKNKSLATLDYIKLAGYIMAANRPGYLRKLKPLMEAEEEQRRLVNRKEVLRRKKVGGKKEIKELGKEIAELNKQIEDMRNALI